MPKCPVCKNECSASDATCKICGFSEIEKSFVNVAEGEIWLHEVVLPYREAWQRSGCRSLLTGLTSMQKGTFYVYLIVDASGWLRGELIGAINASISNLLVDLSKIADDNCVEIQVMVMQYSTGAKWHTEKPIPASDYIHQDVIAGGLTDLGAAYDLLLQELTSRKERYHYPPVIVLLSSGVATDNYAKYYGALKYNQIFGRAIKIAVPIVKDAAEDPVLLEFAGHHEAIVSPNDAFSAITRVVDRTIGNALDGMYFEF